MALSFMEQIAVAIVNARLAVGASLIIGEDTASAARDFAEGCCEVWGHDWDGKTCRRCGSDGDDREGE